MSSIPPSSPMPASPAVLSRPDQSRSLARRMLSGDGAVELTAYRAGETLSSAVHGVSRTGQLVVADVPNLFHSLGAFHTSADIEVRVDIARDSVDHTLALRLASVHLLGTLRWCRDTEAVHALGLQGRVADLVHDVGPRVRVGVITTERILLHDCSGVSAHGPAILVEATAPAPGNDALQDAVLSTAAETLADIADAVLDGGLPGWAEPLEMPGSVLDIGPAHCVDVDRGCVTLARFTGDQGWTVQVPLPVPPHSPSSASSAPGGADAWHHLLAHASSQRITALRP